MQPSQKERFVGLHLPPIGSSLSELATPALLIDLPKLQANIQRGIELFTNSRICLRPHLKTGKTARIARMLIEAGAQGICVAKVSEAVVMCAGGIDDILITSPIGHPITARWFADLLESHPAVRFRVVVDNVAGAAFVSNALAERSLPSLNVLIDVNVGQDRTGVQPLEPARELARQLGQFANLCLIGVQGYEGHLQHLHDAEFRQKRGLEAMTKLTQTADLLRTDGHNISVVTTGGTGTSPIYQSVNGITEVQPGSFIFMDASYIDAVGSANFENALFVLSTVISRPLPERATVDAGWKSLSIDAGPARPLQPDLTYVSAGDEHGFIGGQGAENLKIGDRIKIIPSHLDTTLSLHEVYYVIEDGKLVDIWPIESRGRVQ